MLLPLVFASARLDQLVETARQLAHDGKCGELAAVAQQIETEDDDYFAAVFVDDPQIARCLDLAHDDDRKSPWTAIGLSAGATAAGIGLMAAGSKSTPLTAIGATTFLVGPTVGHIYAGHTWNAALGVRLGAIATGALGLVLWGPCIEGCTSNATTDLGALLFAGSGIVYAGAALYEIASSSGAVDRYNAHLLVTPAPSGAAVSLAGRF